MKILTSAAVIACSSVVSAFIPSSFPTSFVDRKYDVVTDTKLSSMSSTQLSMGLTSSVIKTAQKINTPVSAAVAATAVLGTIGVKTILDKPSRKYEDGSVAREYDAWTQDGILEYYWGEHIHLGYYNEEE